MQKEDYMKNCIHFRLEYLIMQLSPCKKTLYYKNNPLKLIKLQKVNNCNQIVYYFSPLFIQKDVCFQFLKFSQSRFLIF